MTISWSRLETSLYLMDVTCGRHQRSGRQVGHVPSSQGRHLCGRHMTPRRLVPMVIQIVASGIHFTMTIVVSYLLSMIICRHIGLVHIGGSRGVRGFNPPPRSLLFVSMKITTDLPFRGPCLPPFKNSWIRHWYHCRSSPEALTNYSWG